MATEKARYGIDVMIFYPKLSKFNTIDIVKVPRKEAIARQHINQ